MMFIDCSVSALLLDKLYISQQVVQRKKIVLCSDIKKGEREKAPKFELSEWKFVLKKCQM